MFITLLSKEVRQHLMTFRFAAALITTFALVVVSVWILADDYLLRRDTYNLVAEQTAESDSQVFVPSQISPTLHKAPSPLSIFAEGEERRLGNSVRIRRNVVPHEATGSFTDNPLMAALPPFDLLTIFAIVISLFGLLITYDAISGEREEGTLKMVSTGSIRRGSLYAVKFVGGVICIAIPFLISFACCLLLLSFMFNLQFTGSQWAAIAMMALAGIIYASLFIALGLLASTLVRRSSTALVLALLIWALGVLVIPGAAQSASQMFVEPPSPVEVTKLQQEISREFRTKVIELYNKYRGCWSGWNTGYRFGDGCWMFDGSERSFELSANVVREAEPINLQNGQRIWDVQRRQLVRLQRQADLAESLAAIAPVSHLRKAFTLLAGTDISGYERFLSRARRYRENLVNDFRNRGYFGDNTLQLFTRWTKEEITDEARRQRINEFNRLREQNPEAAQQIGPSMWGPLPSDHTPPFSYSGSEPDFNNALGPLAAMIIGILIVFAIGFVVFIRYDVR